MTKKNRSRLATALALLVLALLPSCTWFYDEFFYFERPAPTVEEIEATSCDQ